MRQHTNFNEIPMGSANSKRGISGFRSIELPNMLNWEIAKSEYLKNPKIPKLPTAPIMKNVFLRSIDFVL